MSNHLSCFESSLISMKRSSIILLVEDGIGELFVMILCITHVNRLIVALLQIVGFFLRLTFEIPDGVTGRGASNKYVKWWNVFFGIRIAAILQFPVIFPISILKWNIPLLLLSILSFALEALLSAIATRNLREKIEEVATRRKALLV